MTDVGRDPRASGRRYLLVSPCRNEAKFARRTLDSVVRQSLRPAKWVIVDDGSTDETPELLAEYAARHDFIQVVRREDRGKRSVGPGVIDAFYAGYEAVDTTGFDYVCKLDLDLDLPERYFERLVERMEAEPRLGTCSGKAYYVDGQGELVSEGIGDDVSVGASKFYRKACFDQIGGFVRAVMWDGIDCHRCRMLGWIACSWDDPELRFVHLRPMGSSEVGIWEGRKRHGRGQYFMGTSPVYMLASALFRMTHPPVLVGGLAMLLGYAGSALGRAPRYGDAKFRSFLRRYQLRCLLQGKSAATADLAERRAEAWSVRNAPAGAATGPGA